MTTETIPAIPNPPEHEDAFAPAHEVNTANSSSSVFELADRLLQWKNHKADLAARTKDANEVIGKLESVLSERMLEDEIQNFARSGKNFHLKTTTLASARAGCKDALIEWLEKNGHADLVGQTINANTLKSFVKEIMDNSESGELPEDLSELLNVHRAPAIGILTVNK